MGWFSKKAQPKTDDVSHYPETLARVDENAPTRPVHFDRDENIHHRTEGVDAMKFDSAVDLIGLYQRGDGWMSRVPDDHFPVHYESPVVPALPISQYTGQPYDPAWGVMVGGRSNKAIPFFMKLTEEQIKAREEEHAKTFTRLVKVGALFHPDEDFSAMKKHVQRMIDRGIEYSEIYAAPVKDLAWALGMSKETL